MREYPIRRGWATPAILIVMALLLMAADFDIAPAQGHTDQADGGAMNSPEFYVGKLLGTREGWPNDMTKREEEVMSDHYVYLRNLARDRVCVAAGPVFDEPVYGLIILMVGSEAEARRILDGDPSVREGIHTYELAKMHLSLLMQNTFPFRYVQNPTDREIVKEVVVDCSPSEAWRLWTTVDGLQSFFAAGANIELKIGGPFEIYFSMEAPYGQRGSEGCKILSYLPERMFSFEWNAPPQFGELRHILTRVMIDFESIGKGQTRVTLTHIGFGGSGGWNEVIDYFELAWGNVLIQMKNHVAGK